MNEIKTLQPENTEFAGVFLYPMQFEAVCSEANKAPVEILIINLRDHREYSNPVRRYSESLGESNITNDLSLKEGRSECDARTEISDRREEVK